MSAPTLKFDDYFILEVLIDGGSRVNIRTYETMKKLGLTNLEPILFVIHLVNQRRIKPMVILRGVKTLISGLSFAIDCGFVYIGHNQCISSSTRETLVVPS